MPGERQDQAALIFTAHSIPVAMAKSSPYETQLREACRLVAEAVPHPNWQLAFQSRSGPLSQPWLEPGVESVVRAIATKGDVRELVIVPIGFLHEHMEVVFDLDIETLRALPIAESHDDSGGDAGVAPAIRANGAGIDSRTDESGQPSAWH